MSIQSGTQETGIHQSESECGDPTGHVTTQGEQSGIQDESQTPAVHDLNAEPGMHTLCDRRYLYDLTQTRNSRSQWPTYGWWLRQ